MARVAIYQPGAVQREGATAAKFEAANFNTSPLGEGLQRAGAALSDYAEKKDQIEALYDQQDAQRLDLEHVEQTRLLSEQLRQARGAGARDEANRLEGELQAYNGRLLSQARSPRARRALEDSIARRSSGEIERYHAYADQEFEQDFRATSDARITSLTEAARDIDNEDEAQRAFAEVDGALADRARFEGWEGGIDGPIARAARLRQSTEFYIGRAQALARSGDPQRAIDYAQAHEAEIGGDQLDAFVGGLTEEAREQRMSDPSLPWNRETPATPEVPASGSRTAPVNEGDQPGRFSISGGFTVGDGYGARRSGGGVHRGVDMFAASGTPFRIGQPFEIVESHRQAQVHSGRDGGNIARVRFPGGDEWLAMHLPDLPRAGRYEAGSPVLRSGDSGSASASSPHIHWQPANAAAQSIYNQGRRVVAAHLTGNSRASASAQEPGSNIEAQLAAIDAAGLSYADRQAARRVVQRRHGEFLARREERESEAGRIADNWLADHADDFTSTSQIPGYTNLSPSRRAQLAERARNNREGNGASLTPQMLLEYNYMQLANPQTFASRDFYQRLVQQGAPQALLRQWGGDAGRILGQSANQRAQNVTDQRLWSIAAPILREIGLDFDRADVDPAARGTRRRELTAAERQADTRRKNQMLMRLRELSRIWTEANPGQVPDDALMRGWVGNMLQRGGEGQSFNFEADDQAQYQRMNPGERQLLESQLRARGVPATPENVVRLYRRRMALYSQRRP